MNRTTIEHQVQPRNDRPRRRARLAGAVIALTLPAAALGVVAQRTLVNSRPAPVAAAPVTAAPARCEATYPATKIVTMPYLYPGTKCRARTMLV